MNLVEEVLEFWFGPEADDAAVAQARGALWWGGDAATDAQVRERCAGLHAQAATGQLDAWAATPRGRLALIVLLDQCSRNLFRGHPQAYAQDARALHWLP